MIIKEIGLKNFRNYNGLKLEMSPGINIIYGKNGYGKTNILEAMFLCCIGKSFRTSHDSEMIKSDADNFEVSVKIDDNLFGEVKISLDHKKNKVVMVDGLCINKLRLLMGKLNGILFSPETLSIISEGPSERRRFMDMALCQMSGSYYFAAAMYNKFSNEKNALLAEKFKTDDLTTEIYNENLAKYGAEIMCDRFWFMQKIAVLASNFYNEISEQTEILTVNYVANVKSVNDYFHELSDKNFEFSKENRDEIVKNVENLFKNELNSPKNKEKEREYGKICIGIQRDDFDCKLNDFCVKSFGSQGQKRSAVVALKLAEIEIMKKTTGRTPVLFLDDVLSELDKKRKNKILELTKNYQTFITCTDRDIAEELMASGEKNSAENQKVNQKESAINYIDVEKLR